MLDAISRAFETRRMNEGETKCTVMVIAAGLVACCATARGTARAPSSLPAVTVLAEGYGKPIDGKSPRPFSTDDGGRRAASTIVLVRAQGATIVVDPGLISDRSRLSDRLGQQGVRPAEVTHVVYSHHHPDHTVNTALFPNAIIVDYWSTYKGDVWLDHPDNFLLAPGVRLLRTPGHTNEGATLIVETSDGIYACTHLWGSARGLGRPDSIAENPKVLEVHRQRVLEIADWIIPGHGPMFRSPDKPKP